MGLLIETIDDLKALLKSTGVKVETPSELGGLLEQLCAVYNPDLARVRAVKVISSTAIAISLGSAGICTFYASFGFWQNKAAIAETYWPLFCTIAILWIVAGAVSVMAIILGLLWLRRKETYLQQPSGPAPTGSVGGPPSSTGFTELDLSKFKRVQS